MKRYGSLYPAICDPENIRCAHRNARKGKAHYRDVMRVDADPEKYLDKIRRMLKTETFENSEYSVFIRHWKKDREISRLPYYPDRIVHHCVVQVLEPIWMKVFIRDTFSTIKGRGIHDGVRRMKRFMRDVDGTRYCLKMDVRKFYPSIDHDVLKSILRRSFKCRPTLRLLDTVIDSAPGVPIGNYLSQYFANVYLSRFDHWIKESMNVRYYARYCDDLVILGTEKARLHDLYREAVEYMDGLRLQIKDDHQIFPSRIRGIDFLGYRFFGYKTLVRKRIVKDFHKKLATIRKHWRHMPAPAIVNGVMSYYGWLKHADARGLWKASIDNEIRQIMNAVCTANRIKNPLEVVL
jgi:hypothetical protein